MEKTDIPVIDAHHHIWRRADLAWLNGEPQPRIFGPYQPICRDYPVDEYMAEATACGVVGSVYCQTNWPPGKEVDEVRWVSETAAASGFPQAIVGYCNFLRDDAADVLRQHSAFPNVRGMRMQLHWHENPQYRFAPTPDLMRESAFRRNLALLQDHDWLFELQVFSGQMKDASALVAAFPRIRFVLMHAGMPEDLSPAGMRQWRDGLKRLAEHENVFVKLSAQGTFIHRNDPEHIARIVSEVVALFGTRRCVFGSNFPIEKLWTDFASLMQAYRDATAPFGEEAQKALLHDNARTLYRI